MKIFRKRMMILVFVLSCLMFAEVRERGWMEQATGFGENFYSVSSANSSESWMVGDNGLLIYTADAGETWSQQISGVTETLWGVSFCDENNGTATGNGGAIIHTTNGGQTWNVVQDGWWITFYGADMFNENIALVAGQNTIMAPLVTFTTNGWQTMESCTYYLEPSPGNMHEGMARDIVCLAADIWFTANTSWQGEGAIARTTNGGDSWETIHWTNNALTAIQFPDADHGFAVGDGGIILSSSDGGNTWAESYIPGAGLLHDVHFIDAATGWVSGDNGFIAKTEDGGISWEMQDTNIFSELTGIHFVDETNGRASGFYGVTLYTTTGGSQDGMIAGTVTLQEGAGNLQEVEISIDGTIVQPDSLGEYSVILEEGIYEVTASLEYYTSQIIEDVVVVAGETTAGIDFVLDWVMVLNPPQGLEIDPFTGIINFLPPIYYPGTVLIGYNVYLDNELLAMINDLSYELYGLENGTVYTVGVSAVYEQGESEMITEQFIYLVNNNDESNLKLCCFINNYPNPFNPSTTIEFMTDIDSHTACIVIYDVKGRKVKSLVVDPASSFEGIYSVVWNGTDEWGKAVSSGIYFARLILAETNTKYIHKMLMIK